MLSLYSHLFEPTQEKSQDNKWNDFLDGIAKFSYHERLTLFLRGSTRHWVTGGTTVVDFRPLYTVNLHHLQRQLAKEIAKLETEVITDSRLEAIQKTLCRYTDALRDFEFIHANRWNTQFVKNIAASPINTGSGSKLQEALLTDLGLEVPDTHRSLFHDSDLLGLFVPTLMEHSMALAQCLGTEQARGFANGKWQAEFVMVWNSSYSPLSEGWSLWSLWS